MHEQMLAANIVALTGMAALTESTCSLAKAQAYVLIDSKSIRGQANAQLVTGVLFKLLAGLGLPDEPCLLTVL